MNTMTSSIETTPRTAARIAGIGYVAIFVLAIFANFYVREGLIDATDPIATVSNVAGSEGLFRAGLAAFVIIFLLDVPVAWGLYIVFKRAGEMRSLLAAWFRIVYTVFLGVAAVFMFVGLRLVTAAPGAEMLDPGTSLLMFDAFNYTWLVGLIAFGVHLVLLGWMILGSRMAPRFLGWALTVAGVAYMLDTMAQTTLSDYASVSGVMLAVVAVPSILAEATFTWWLLFRAGRDEDAVVRELSAA
jgi:hypothetical protein